MIKTESQKQTAHESDQRMLKAEFEKLWTQKLEPKAEAFKTMPKSAIAYQLAWEGFRAGKGFL